MAARGGGGSGDLPLSLANHPWVRKMRSGVATDAVRFAAVIVVPVIGSLIAGDLGVTADTLKHHCLSHVQSSSSGAFHDALGHACFAAGHTLVAVHGQVPQSVRIMSVHTHPRSQVLPPGQADGVPSQAEYVSLYMVSRPLLQDIGIAVPTQDDDVDVRMAEVMLFALGTVPAAQPALANIAELIADIKTTAAAAPDGAALSALNPPLPTIVATAVRLTLEQLCIAASVEPMAGQSAPPARPSHLAAAVETFMMHRLHGVIMPWLARLNIPLVQRLHSVLRALQPLTAADLGVKAKFRCDTSEFVATLAGLDSASAPLEKLAVLSSAVGELKRSAARHARSQGSTSVEIGADDVADLLLYSLIRGSDSPYVLQLVVHLDFIDKFHVTRSPSSEFAYQYANVCQAVNYLLSRGAEEFRGLLRTPMIRTTPSAGTSRASTASTHTMHA